jgi:dTDP-glucose pyrophosphorylase
MQQAISNLDQVAIKIVLIVNENHELVGTVSDGDIRRGLLRGLDLSSPVASIIHRDALVVPPGMARETVTKLMVANKIMQIPVVDEHRRVIGMHLWDELVAPLERVNQMIIMAGGRGSRLHPDTASCPKPMLLVSGRPMLEHIIERAKENGFRRFVLAVHYLGHMIEDFFGDGSRWNVQINYLREEMPLGTAGALSLIACPPSESFVVTNGDVLTDISYGELVDFHARHSAVATMAVRKHEWQNPFGVVKTSGLEIIGFEEKPVTRTHINAGVYVLSPESLDYLASNKVCDMPMLFDRLRAASCRTVAYPMHEPWLDIGHHDDLKKAREGVPRIA